MQGASVKFWSVVFRPDYDVIDEPIGETGGGTTAMPIILNSNQTTIISNANGLASLTPSAGVPGAVEIEVLASVGTNATQQFDLESFWTSPGSSSGPGEPGTATLLPAKRGIWACPDEDDICELRSDTRRRWRGRYNDEDGPRGSLKP